MNGYHSKQPRFWRGLSAAIGLTGILLWPSAVRAQNNNAQSKPLSWARIDFLTNRVQFVPRQARSRRARISDILGIGDAIRTYEAANAELRFNDGSMARIGERATFRFTPNTRNFQLTNGTALLLIPPGRGRTTIQTPNAVTGIQGSALFVRYIEETDTTIVGSLTNNPEGPMILYNEDGSEQQALYANEIGVVEGDRITDLYQFDGELFWESSGLAEGFDYTESGNTGADDLDGVRQEIREAIADQAPIEGDGVVENPATFSRPEEETPDVNGGAIIMEEGTNVPEPTEPAEESSSETLPEGTAETSQPATSGEDSPSNVGDLSDVEPANTSDTSNPELTITAEEIDTEEASALEFEGSPAEEYLNPKGKPATEPAAGVTNSLAPVPLTEAEAAPEETADTETEAPDVPNNRPNSNGSGNRPGRGNRPNNINNAPDTDTTPGGDDPIADPVLPNVPDSTDNTDMPIESPTTDSGNNTDPVATPNEEPEGVTPSDPVATPSEETEGVAPLPPSALEEAPNAAEDPVESPDDAVINQPDPAPVSTDDPVIDAADPTPTEAVPAAEPTGAANEAPETGAETGAEMPVLPENTPEPTGAEAIEVPPTETPPTEAVSPETTPVIPEEVIPETVMPEEMVLPEDTGVPEAAESIIQDNTFPEEVDGQIPSQLMEEAVPFPVEQTDDLPTMSNTDDEGGEMMMPENSEDPSEMMTEPSDGEQPNTEQPNTEQPNTEQPNTEGGEAAPILL